MVDLPKVQDRVVTSTAPTSSVSSGDITGPTDAMAGALTKVADATMGIATEMAKQQAADDLQNQKVVRNEDGSVSVANPANSIIFGRAGEAYNEAVKAGTISQHANVISETMTDLHQKYPADPLGFKDAAKAFRDRYAQDHGGGVIGEGVMQRIDATATQHLNAITNTAGNIDITNQQKSIQAAITDQKNTLQGLARQPGGTNTPEFRESLERMKASYQALGTNPLFKMPQDQIDLEVKNFTNLLQGEAIVSHIDDTFTKKGKGDAQKALNESILQNPNLSEADRNRLYSHGLARLQYLSADAKERIDAGRKVVGEIETNVASGTIKPTDPIIGMEINAARERGDAESANRILAATTVRMSLNGIQTLPQTVQAEVLGIKPTGVVNQSIPIEGRALLDHIAGPESNGRYDVRYGGATFKGYGDHPRIAEPITSGPDVGKTSSAAGRYQFIGTTWDQQARKLGLTDFSPANQDAAAWDLAQTEYKTKTGKDLLTVLKSGDQAAINEVPRTLSGQWASLPGGRQPAGGSGPAIAPAAAPGRPGFTAAELKANPFLGSAYIRTIAADESLRIQSATQAAEGIGKAVDKGLLPRPEDVALVNQTAQQYPEKFGPTAEAMNGRLLGGALAAMEKPQRDAVIAQYRDATNGQDQHHINVAAAALDQYQKSEKALVEHPYQEAATRGWIAPVSPIDPGRPDSIPGALGERVAASQRIAAMNHSPAPPVLDKDEMPQLQAALDGPQGAAVLASIATSLRPDDMKTLLGQKGFSDTLTAMQSSKDPVKMSTAMSVVDKLWRDNAAEAEKTLGNPAITKLQAWQALKGSFNAVELAEKLNMSDDPSTVKAREDAKEAAEKEVKSLTPADMAYKLGTSWGIPLVSRAVNPITGATPAAPFDSIKGGELVADYRTTYTALRTYGVDADKASDLALERLKSTWGVSAAAGNQIMKNPPERSYPAIGGSHDWMAADLNKWVAAKAGPEFREGMRSIEAGVGFSGRERNWSLAGMIADGQTQAEIAAGRPPSYQVAIKKADGTLDIMRSRIAFDPADHVSTHGAALEGKRLRADQLRAGQSADFIAANPLVQPTP